MTHLLKLTTAIALVVLTPMAASAEWVLIDPNAQNPADLMIDPPVLIEIERPGPPPVFDVLNPSIVVRR